MGEAPGKAAAPHITLVSQHLGILLGPFDGLSGLVHDTPADKIICQLQIPRGSAASNLDRSVMESSRKRPASQDWSGDQKRARGDRSNHERGHSRGGGAPGGRNKRADMGRKEWRYGVNSRPLLSYPLINEAAIP